MSIHEFCKFCFSGVKGHFAFNPLFESAGSHAVVSWQLSEIFDLSSWWITPVFRVSFFLLSLLFGLNCSYHRVSLCSPDFKSRIFVHFALDPLGQSRRAHAITTREFSVIFSLHFRGSFLSHPVSRVLFLGLNIGLCLLLLLGIKSNFVLFPSLLLGC